MKLDSLWLGRFLHPADLAPGDLFIDGNFLGLKLDGAAMVAICTLDGEGTFEPFSILKFDRDRYTSDLVRVIDHASLEPVDLTIAGLLPNSKSLVGFRYSPQKETVVAIVNANGRRAAVDLTTGKPVAADDLLPLPPLRLVWREGEREIELCRV